MTKFEKLNEAIENMSDQRKNKHADDNRRKLLIELGQIRTPDIRYKWERKELMNKIDELQEMIAKKRFF